MPSTSTTPPTSTSQQHSALPPTTMRNFGSSTTRRTWWSQPTILHDAWRLFQIRRASTSTFCAIMPKSVPTSSLTACLVTRTTCHSPINSAQNFSKNTEDGVANSFTLFPTLLLHPSAFDLNKDYYRRRRRHHRRCGLQCF